MKRLELTEPPVDMEYIRLRCREVDGCWLWSLGTKLGDGKVPVCGFTRQDADGVRRKFNFYVRHLAYWLRTGKRPVFGRTKAMVPTCGNTLCVHPDHQKIITKSALNKAISGFQSSAAFREKVARGRRKISKLSDAAVSEIRVSERSPDELASEYGISPAYVYMLRRGEYRRDLSSPFGGLIR